MLEDRLEASRYGLPGAARAWWGSLILLVALALPLVLLAFVSEGLDFRAYYVAAKSTAAHLNPYVDHHPRGEEFTDSSNDLGISRWIYPPPALFFVTPLAWSSVSVTRSLFDLLSIGCLISIVWFFAQRLALHWYWQALAFLSFPALACIQRGQIDILILFCMFLTYRLLGSYWAGIPLGVAISIKIFPATLLLWLLLDRRFKEVASATAFALAVHALAVWRFGFSSYASFLHSVTMLHTQTSASGAPQMLGPWLSLSPGFVGSYNNPLIFFNSAGVVAGFLLTVGATLLLYARRVDAEAGFFSAVLLSQLMNTTLWTMGMVLYIPISLIAIARVRSWWSAALLLLPLYLPSQIRVFGVTPRFVIALGLLAWVVARSAAASPSLDEEKELNGQLASA